MSIIKETGCFLEQGDITHYLLELKDYLLDDILGYQEGERKPLSICRTVLILLYSENSEKCTQRLEYCPGLKVLQKNEVQLNQKEFVRYYQVDSGALKLTTLLP